MTERLTESEARERNFLMSVSHELRTPLTAIRGHVVGAARGRSSRIPSSGRARSRSSRRRRGGSSGSSATSSTWRSSTRTASRVLPRGGRHGAARRARVRDVQRAGAARARSTTASTSSASPVIVSDGDRVLQIVDNLLSNAFRATPGRRPDRARARPDERHGPRRRRGHRARASRRTSAERLFRPFVSGDGGGTGLGLTIARELSPALGGRSSSTPSPAAGSRFELVLPAD